MNCISAQRDRRKDIFSNSACEQRNYLSCFEIKMKNKQNNHCVRPKQETRRTDVFRQPQADHGELS